MEHVNGLPVERRQVKTFQLPAAWSTYISKSKPSQIYYFNHLTGDSKWELPVLEQTAYKNDTKKLPPTTPRSSPTNITFPNQYNALPNQHNALSNQHNAHPFFNISSFNANPGINYSTQQLFPSCQQQSRPANYFDSKLENADSGNSFVQNVPADPSIPGLFPFNTILPNSPINFREPDVINDEENEDEAIPVPYADLRIKLDETRLKRSNSGHSSELDESMKIREQALGMHENFHSNKRFAKYTISVEEAQLLLQWNFCADRNLTNFDQKLVLVLDTNMLMHNLEFVSILRLAVCKVQRDVNIIVPCKVLMELNTLKANSSLARTANYFLNVHLNKDSKFKGESWLDAKNKDFGIPMMDSENSDLHILNCCMQCAERGHKVILLSNDVSFCNLATSNNIDALQYVQVVQLLQNCKKMSNIQMGRISLKSPVLFRKEIEVPTELLNNTGDFDVMKIRPTKTDIKGKKFITLKTSHNRCVEELVNNAPLNKTSHDKIVFDSRTTYKPKAIRNSLCAKTSKKEIVFKDKALPNNFRQKMPHKPIVVKDHPMRNTRMQIVFENYPMETTVQSKTPRKQIVFEDRAIQNTEQSKTPREQIVFEDRAIQNTEQSKTPHKQIIFKDRSMHNTVRSKAPREKIIFEDNPTYIPSQMEITFKNHEVQNSVPKNLPQEQTMLDDFSCDVNFEDRAIQNTEQSETPHKQIIFKEITFKNCEMQNGVPKNLPQKQTMFDDFSCDINFEEDDTQQTLVQNRLHDTFLQKIVMFDSNNYAQNTSDVTMKSLHHKDIATLDSISNVNAKPSCSKIVLNTKRSDMGNEEAKVNQCEIKGNIDILLNKKGEENINKQMINQRRIDRFSNNTNIFSARAVDATNQVIKNITNCTGNSSDDEANLDDDSKSITSDMDEDQQENLKNSSESLRVSKKQHITEGNRNTMIVPHERISFSNNSSKIANERVKLNQFRTDIIKIGLSKQNGCVNEKITNLCIANQKKSNITNRNIKPSNQIISFNANVSRQQEINNFQESPYENSNIDMSLEYNNNLKGTECSNIDGPFVEHGQLHSHVPFNPEFSIPLAASTLELRDSENDQSLPVNDITGVDLECRQENISHEEQTEDTTLDHTITGLLGMKTFKDVVPSRKNDQRSNENDSDRISTISEDERELQSLRKFLASSNRKAHLHNWLWVIRQKMEEILGIVLQEHLLSIPPEKLISPPWSLSETLSLLAEVFPSKTSHRVEDIMLWNCIKQLNQLVKDYIEVEKQKRKYQDLSMQIIESFYELSYKVVKRLKVIESDRHISNKLSEIMHHIRNLGSVVNTNWFNKLSLNIPPRSHHDRLLKRSTKICEMEDLNVNKNIELSRPPEVLMDMFDRLQAEDLSPPAADDTATKHSSASEKESLQKNVHSKADMSVAKHAQTNKAKKADKPINPNPDTSNGRDVTPNLGAKFLKKSAIVKPRIRMLEAARPYILKNKKKIVKVKKPVKKLPAYLKDVTLQRTVVNDYRVAEKDTETAHCSATVPCGTDNEIRDHIDNGISHSQISDCCADIIVISDDCIKEHQGVRDVLVAIFEKLKVIFQAIQMKKSYIEVEVSSNWCAAKSLEEMMDLVNHLIEPLDHYYRILSLIADEKEVCNCKSGIFMKAVKELLADTPHNYSNLDFTQIMGHVVYNMEQSINYLERMEIIKSSFKALFITEKAVEEMPPNKTTVESTTVQPLKGC